MSVHALGRFQNPEREPNEGQPSGHLPRAAAIGEEHRHLRSPRPKKKTAASLVVGQHRRPGFAARRSASARPQIKWPITQPEMPESTHATVA
jgi:hypothetical protein